MVRRLAGLDDLARVVFPDSRTHRRVFIALWTGIKYSDRQFRPSGMLLPDMRDISPKTTEVVRAKMKRLGLIKRISHFNPAYGGVSGWTFSTRFASSLRTLATGAEAAMRSSEDDIDEKKDRNSAFYV